MELQELQKSFLDLQNNYKKIEEEKKSLELKLEEETKEKLKLQTHNHELFLRITSPKEDNKPKEEKHISIDDLVDMYKKEH